MSHAKTNMTKSNELAECSIAYRSKIKADERVNITQSSDLYDYLRGVYNPDTIEHREEFYIIMLTRKPQVLGWVKISAGGLANTTCDPRIIFQAALLANAHAIVLSHNHPSGNFKPSQADIELTRKLVQAGSILEIQVLDHIIMTEDGYLSMADEGLL